MIRLIDNTTHMYRDRMHIFLVHRNTSKMIVTLIMAAVFILGLMVSCADPELVPSTQPTFTRKHIILDTIALRTIKPHDDFRGLKTNPKGEKHIYKVYRLPSTDAGTLELILTLNYKESDLKDKTFLLVTSNTSTAERSFSSILPSLHHVTGTAPNPDNTQFSESLPPPNYNKTTAPALFSQETLDYKDLKAYNDAVDNTPSERTFKFRKNEKELRNKGYTTKLYVKKENTIKERTIRMLFWVQEDKLDNNTAKMEAKSTLQDLADRFLDGDDSIYQKMYDINGKHVWDYDESLKDNAASKNPTEIHIGIGEIQTDTDKKRLIGGFVTPYVAFKDMSKLFLSNAIEEEYYAPTVYLNIEYLNRSISNKNKFDMYSTLVHELQHIAVYSSRRLQKPQYVNGRLVVYSERQWFNELLAVSMEHILGYDLVQAVGGTPNSDLFTWRGDPYYSRLIKDEIITTTRLAPPDNANALDTNTYELYRVFSMYLFGNYGINVLPNVLKSGKKNGSAIFDAIKRTGLYQSNDETFPNNFSEVVNDFYVSILLSDTANLGDGINEPTSTLTFFAPIDDANIKKDATSNIAKYGLTIIPRGPPSHTALTFNIINANIIKIGGVIDMSPPERDLPSNRSGIMPTKDLWTQGRGPIIDTPETAKNIIQLNNALGRFIYLGGRLPDGEDKVRNLAFTFTKNVDKHLQLKLTMTPGVVSSLIIVTKAP